MAHRLLLISNRRFSIEGVRQKEMIASIHGVLEARRADQAIVRVGGLSLRIFAPSSTLNRLGEPGSEGTLHTHFQVREDGMALYGFTAEPERDAFEQLLGIS